MLKNIALLAFCALAVADEQEWSSSRGKRSSGLIVNGQNAGKGKYPGYAVLLLYGNFLCGGAIINKKAILTAAHCIVYSKDPYVQSRKRYSGVIGDVIQWGKRYTFPFKRKPNANAKIDDYQVIVGKYRYNRIDGDEQYFDVKRISADNYTFPNDDIAIMHLKGKMTYTKYVQPMTLAKSPKDENFTNCYAIGMGYSTETIVDGDAEYGDPRVLQELAADFQRSKRCKRLHVTHLLRPRNTFTKKHLCTLTKDSGACYGDSGGPIGCFNAEGRFVQMGIVSYGTRFCQNGFAVYTRVTQYRQWIKDNS